MARWKNDKIRVMDKIMLDDFKKLDIRVGKILSVEEIVGADKLYKLQVDIGEKLPVQIVTGLVPYYNEGELQGKKIIVLVNLEPAKFKGEISQGMLLCAVSKDECVLLSIEKDIAQGSPIS